MRPPSGRHKLAELATAARAMPELAVELAAATLPAPKLAESPDLAAESAPELAAASLWRNELAAGSPPDVAELAAAGSAMPELTAPNWRRMWRRNWRPPLRRRPN